MAQDIFSLNKGGSGWNYSDPDKPGYMPKVTGTVVEVNEVQSINYQTRKPEWWDDGNPKLNIELVIQGQSGREVSFQFPPTQTNNAFNAVKNALKAVNPNANRITEIGGMLIEVSTHGSRDEYHVRNPRPWNIQILGQGNAPYRGEHKWQPTTQQQPVQQQSMQQQPMYQQPQMQQQPNYQQQQNMAMYGQPTPPTPLDRQFNNQQQQQQPSQQQPIDYNQMIPNQQQQHIATVYDDEIPF